MGDAASRIVVDGTTGGELRIAAGGETDGEDGAIFVRATSVGGGLDGIAVEQREETGTTDIELVSGVTEQILIQPDGDVMAVIELDTLSYEASFGYQLGNSAFVDQPEIDLEVRPGGGALGGDLVLDVLGAIRLAGGAIEANDHAVGLVSSGPISALPGDENLVTIDDPSALLLIAADGRGQPASAVDLVVASDDPLELSGLANDDFALDVDGAGGIVVTQVEPDIGNAPLLDGGVSAGRDLALETVGVLVLGSSESTEPVVLSAGRDVSLTTGGVVVDNVHAIASSEEVIDPMTQEVVNVIGVQEIVNDAAVIANRDILIGGSLDTATGASVHASVELRGERATTFGGDVGMSSPLRRLEVLDAELGTTGTTDRRIFVVGEGAFLGKIDGEGTAEFATDASALADPEDEQLLFGGNVGSGSDLEGFQADSRLVVFTTAESVRTGSEGIEINTNRDLMGNIPGRATVGDRNGNLTLESEGAIELGPLHKLSAVGNLRIHSDMSVSVGDLNANKIVIDSPSIQMLQREAGTVDVEIDGELTEPPVGDPDRGVDWVANQIRTTSAIQLAGDPGATGGVPRLVIGSGGIRSPSDFDQFQVQRFSKGGKGITENVLLASDGETLLDLVGDLDAPGLVGDPVSELVREEPLPEPVADARLDGAKPVPAPRPSAAQLLALIRCEGRDCAPPTGRGALITPRARELVRVYHERITSQDGRVRLRATFTVAGRAYREAGARGIDGAAFYDFLAASDLFEDARGEIDTLAGLLAQVSLLGLSPEDARVVQGEIAGSFAQGAALRGFELPQVLDAVDRSPVGLIPEIASLR